MELKNALNFLMELEVNNDRNWFKENEAKYKAAKTSFEAFINDLIPELKKMDKSIDVENAKSCMFRIFRDVRFSKNKDPYKTNFGAYIARGGRKSAFAGYYVHMQPEESFLGGGVYMPQSPQLKAIRTAIFDNPTAFKKIIDNSTFKKTFPELYGDKLKSAPRGFPKDFPDLELIKFKHYVVSHAIDNKFWMKGNIVEKTLQVFEKQVAFNSYLNTIIEKV